MIYRSNGKLLDGLPRNDAMAELSSALSGNKHDTCIFDNCII
jgi:hypothetical protein